MRSPQAGTPFRHFVSALPKFDAVALVSGLLVAVWSVAMLLVAVAPPSVRRRLPIGLAIKVQSQRIDTARFVPSALCQPLWLAHRFFPPKPLPALSAVHEHDAEAKSTTRPRPAPWSRSCCRATSSRSARRSDTQGRHTIGPCPRRPPVGKGRCCRVGFHYHRAAAFPAI